MFLLFFFGSDVGRRHCVLPRGMPKRKGKDVLDMIFPQSPPNLHPISTQSPPNLPPRTRTNRGHILNRSYIILNLLGRSNRINLS